MAKECSDGMAATKLSDILESDSELANELMETIGETPELKADCNDRADIYVEVDGDSMKVRVFCAKSADGEPTVCEEVEDEDGNPMKMVVPSN